MLESLNKKIFLLCRIGYHWVDLDFLGRIYNNPPRFNTEKARTVLGLSYIDIAKTANDMAESMVNLGFVPKAV